MATSLKRIIENLGRSKLRTVLGTAAALCVAAVTVLDPLKNTAYYYYGNLETYSIFSNSYSLSEEHTSDKDFSNPVVRQIVCRDAVYSDLCTLGTIYLSNCDSQYGNFTGTAELYEEMYANLSCFSTTSENLFGVEDASNRGITISQSHYDITSVDSDYYWFYVEYDGHYLTNIPDIGSIGQNNRVSRLRYKFFKDKDYYLRFNDEITVSTEEDEGGYGKTEVYYTQGTTTGGSKLTSEYIDSDELLLGAAGYDSFGNYTYCFYESGDFTAKSYSGNGLDDYYYDGVTVDNYGNLTIHGQIESYDAELNEWASEDMMWEVYKSSEDYLEIVNSIDGATNEDGEYITLKEFGNYEFTSIDTSKLTVFMSPKVDIAETSAAVIASNKTTYERLTLAENICIGLWLTCTAAFFVLSVVRKKADYAEDNEGFLTKLFKIDFSILVLAGGVFLLLLAIGDCNDIVSSEYSVSRLYPTIAALSQLAVGMSLNYIVRHFKVNGIKGKPKLLILDIFALLRRLWDRFLDSRPMHWVRNRPIIHRFWTATIFTFLVLAVVTAYMFFQIAEYGYVSGSCTVFIAAAFIVLAVYIRYVSRIVSDIVRIDDQIDEMFETDENAQKKSGKKKREIKKSSPVYYISTKLSEASERAREAVEKQVQSEKMKIELVTNVSHDLKTPLTSIISYIDLLQKEELSGEANDYVQILSRKADKLRDIVSDVFTLAKATSGVEIDMSPLDYVILLRQVLADIGDKITDSGRDVRVEEDCEAAPITGDGNKLYRVIQNLLDNALKYSMEGTRIYVRLYEEKNFYCLSVKNVSAYEMLFTGEEITERFTRGDKSRTDGGSGLGLSIAKSFTEACGGRFEVVVDGDIFLAKACFERREVTEEEQKEQGEEQDSTLTD